jgi:tetraacyldisaccharide 4'-kinase
VYREKITFWVEEFFYRPNSFQKILSYLLLPFSFLYCFLGRLRRKFAKKEDFALPIISVGNLTIGGSGKTPFCISLSQELDKCAIILRGYKRESCGLVVVKDFENILCDVKTSGDEAMLYATKTNALVIVSEDRKVAIKKAKELGAKVILLDDGFGKANIKKFDILIKPNPKPANNFCLPSGAYRESVSNYKNANLVVKEDVDFSKKSFITNKTEKMVLVTAIANPKRLDKFLPPNLIDKVYFSDHYNFKKDELLEILEKTKATSILTTTKDMVKMKEFNLPLSILELELEISLQVKKKIENYLNEFSV